MSLELAVLEKVSPIELFKDNGLDPILKKITEEVKAFVPDLTTEKGRKEIASMAYKVAKSKTVLDDLGKDLVSEWKEQSKKVDNERKRMREYLDALKDEVRKPLTEYEEREEKRLQKHKDGIAKIEIYKINYGSNSSIEQLTKAISELNSIELSVGTWDEFQGLALSKFKESLTYLEDLLLKRNQYEKEQAELEQLRKEKTEREQREREEKIAQEAAEKARLEAEAKAKKEAQEAEEKKQAELKAAKEESDRKEKERLDAIENQKKAEEATRLAEQRAKEAAEKAEKDKAAAEERAREQERLRIQREKEAEQEEIRKREADFNHRKTINNEILVALKAECGLEDVVARSVIERIVQGKIPNVKISY